MTQKRPRVSHFPTARWVALGHENESTGLPESSKRHWKTKATPRTPIPDFSANGRPTPQGMENYKPKV
jgi:hypothetical protein